MTGSFTRSGIKKGLAIWEIKTTQRFQMKSSVYEAVLYGPGSLLHDLTIIVIVLHFELVKLNAILM